MAKVMFQFQHQGTKPGLDEVCKSFGFSQEELDKDYGVVLVDSQESLYVVLAEEAARNRVEGRVPAKARGTTGFYSNPRIEPFGPPEPSSFNNKKE